MQDRIEIINEEEWNQAWQYIDNCWRIESNNQREFIYYCKLNGPKNPKKNQNGLLWKHCNCVAKTKVVIGENTVHAEKIGEWDIHNHSLDVLDKLASCNFVARIYQK